MKNVLLKSCRELCIKPTQIFRILMMAGIFCLAAFAQVSAQTIAVRGKVVDSRGLNLAGVAVKIKGTQTGTTTDTQGAFSINAPSNGTLEVSFLGFSSQDVAIGGKTSLVITLSEAQQALDEVVVTAFGVTKERRGLVSSVQEVKGDQFTQARDNNIATALTGRIAGLDAAQINAGPGASSKVSIRGANIISGGNNQPLYVVDGLPIRNPSNGAANGAQSFNVDRGDGISMINPDDIETISVLKGGAAAALYGSQAANGVILITTKTGKAQTGVGVELNSVANVHSISVYPVYQYIYGQGPANTTAWTVPATLALAQASGRLSFGPKIDPTIQAIQVDGLMHPYEAHSVRDNIDNFYDTAKDFTNSIAFSGGNQQFNVRLSLTDVRSNAQQPHSTFTRQGGVLTTSANLGKNNFISIKGGLNYTQVEGRNRPNVGYAEYSADWPIYLIANTVDIRSLSPGITATGNELAWNLAQEAPNPYFVVNYMENSDKSQRFIINGDIKMNILKNLSLDLAANRDFQLQDNYNYTPLLKNSQPNGTYASSYGTNWQTNIYSTLTYNASFLKDFNTTVSVGGTQVRGKGLSSNLSGTNWVIPNFFSTSNLGVLTGNTSPGSIRGESKSGTNSAMGTFDLDWKKKVYIHATARNDWFSQLNRGTNSILYPSIGTAIILSDLIKMPAKINELKLSASWAEVGLATVSAGQVRQAYSISTNNIYGLPTLGVSSSLLNPTLRPLHVDTWEGGFETQLLGSRLGLEATYYNKTSHDDILNLTLSAASGFSGGNGNVGSIRNQGVELTLTGTPIRNTNFSWNANVNFTLNRSKVVSLDPSITEISNGTGVQGPKFVSKPGLPYSTLEGNVYATNAAGQVIYSTVNNFPLTQEVALGSGYQPYLYGMTNDLRYKQFSMSIQLDGKFGGVAFTNQEQYATRFGLTEESLPGRETGLTVTGVDQNGAAYTHTYVPGIDLYGVYNRASTYPGQFVHSNDFVKLRRFTLGYNIPVNKLKAVKLRNARISLVGSNLMNIYQVKVWKDLGIDYEQEESTDNGQGGGGVSAPHTRVIGLNLQVSF